MKTKSIYRHIGELFISAIAIVSYFAFIKGTAYENELFALTTAIVGFSIGSILNFCTENKKNLILSFRCYFTSIKNKDVYISLSYLFRIKVKGGNKYLMVRGNKIKHQYQPVGGVYKKFNSLQFKFNQWGAREAKNDTYNSDDLRFFIKGKMVPDVVRWFNTRINREVDVWREFYEELISSKILPEEPFSYIKPEYLYSRHEQLILRKGIETYQYLIYDVFSIEFTTDQEKAIEDLLGESVLTDKYAFVDEDELNKELFIVNDNEYPLGFHSKYLK
jgi:hypothetical protein